MKISNLDKLFYYRLLRRAEQIGIRYRLPGHMLVMAMHDGRLDAFKEALMKEAFTIEKELNE